MIVAEQKTLSEMKTLIGSAQNVLVVGCGTCVTVCFAGGAWEAAITASSLRMSTKLDGNGRNVTDVTVQRQCEWEYLDEIADQVAENDVILSLGGGIGVQAIAEHFPNAWSQHQLPGAAQRTRCLGRTVRRLRRLHFGLDQRHLPHRPLLQIAAQRPLRRFRSRPLQINPDVPCAWQLIYDRLSSMGKLDLLLELQPPKNWRTSLTRQNSVLSYTFVGQEQKIAGNGYLVGSTLERVLRAGHFAVTGELGPPQSADGEVIRRKAALLKGFCDAVNLTDNQTAIARMSSIGAGTIVVM